MKNALAAALAALAIAGCTSFTPLQSSMFTNEDGEVLCVDYGRDSKFHESTFIAPSGKEMTMRSKLKVRVTLPDGTSFLAWECMNPLSTGTMYRTNNQKWMFHAEGIYCRAFKKAVNPRGQQDYVEVFSGIICQGPKRNGK